MTTPKPVPASYEEIAELKRVREIEHKRPARLSAGVDTLSAPLRNWVDDLIARIEADRAQIKRCHAIIQSFVAITDPDAGPHLDAAMELNGEFCPGECTHECEERAEADRARIGELEETTEAMGLACRAAREQIRAKDEEIARLETTIKSQNRTIAEYQDTLAESEPGR